MEEGLFYTVIQDRWLSYTRIPICSLSILSNLIIIRLVVCYNKCKGPYQRILLCVGCFDIIFNVGWLIQPFAIRSIKQSFCNTAAMVTQLGFGTFFYTAMLSLYFVLTIKSGMRDEKFTKWYEPWMHIVCISYSLATSISGLIMQGYKAAPTTLTCFFYEYPKGCSNDPNTGCHTILIWLFMVIPQVVLATLIITNYIIIYYHVYTTIYRTRSRSLFLADVDDSQTRRVRAVAVQAILYIAAYLTTTLPFLVLGVLFKIRVMDHMNINHAFTVIFIMYLLIPLTGFLNMCVYIRPQYIKNRSDHPSMGRLWAIRRCCHLGGGEPITTTQTQQAHAQARTRKFLAATGNQNQNNKDDNGHISAQDESIDLDSIKRTSPLNNSTNDDILHGNVSIPHSLAATAVSSNSITSTGMRAMDSCVTAI